MKLSRKTCFLVWIIAIASFSGCSIRGGSMPPDLTLTVAGDEFDVTLGSYCWDRLCADAIYPPVIDTFVTLAADGQISLEFGNPDPNNLFIGLERFDTFPEADPVATERHDSMPGRIVWNPNVPAGEYVLSVTARWGQGEDALYHIGVVIP